jgi:predicted small metal-binding protein
MRCDYVVKAHTMDELMTDAFQHTAEVHGIEKYTDAKMAEIEGVIKYDQEC